MVNAQTPGQQCTYFSKSNKPKECFFSKKVGEKQLKHGSYTSYYESGAVKSKGNFQNGVSSGIWSFYNERGVLKMQGEIIDGKNEGLWKYYTDNGKLSSEGTYKGGQKEGTWTAYNENGTVKSKGEFVANVKTGLWTSYDNEGKSKSEGYYTDSSYTEYYKNTRIKVQGEVKDNVSNGVWKYYYENGSLSSTGFEKDGKKTGNWVFYHPNGKIQGEGTFENNQMNGNWKFYTHEGMLSSQGQEVNGVKDGKWIVYDKKGVAKGECEFKMGEGIYTETSPDGQVVKTGKIINEKRNGEWKYYYPDGALEGTCYFEENTGYYRGYYKSGKLKLEGRILNGKKEGVWKLYKETGELITNSSEFFEMNIPAIEEADTVRVQTEEVKVDTANATPPKVVADTTQTKSPPRLKTTAEKSKAKIKAAPKPKPRKIPYQVKGYMISTNPFATLSGHLPVAVEYFVPLKFGISAMYIYNYNPFYSKHDFTVPDKIYTQGSAFSLRALFYGDENNLGVLYFGPEMRYAAINRNMLYTDSLSASLYVPLEVKETRAELTITLGNKFLYSMEEAGLFADFYVGGGVGYRKGKYNWTEPRYDNFYKQKNKPNLYIPFRLGFMVGYLF